MSVWGWGGFFCPRFSLPLPFSPPPFSVSSLECLSLVLLIIFSDQSKHSKHVCHGTPIFRVMNIINFTAIHFCIKGHNKQKIFLNCIVYGALILSNLPWQFSPLGLVNTNECFSIYVACTFLSFCIHYVLVSITDVLCKNAIWVHTWKKKV